MTTFLSTILAVCIVLVSSAFLVDNADASGTGQTFCGEEPCVIPLRSSCEYMLENYQFQGSCCALEIIPATGGCRITVGYGNCFWYPFCGDCEKDGALYVKDQCNVVFETNALEKVCPKYDYDPLVLQNVPNFRTGSCAPSMAPISASMTSDSPAIATGNGAPLLVALLGSAILAVP